jgi:hypothetical protein
MTMIERLGLATDSDLESALRDLGTAIAWPPTPGLAAAVAARLRVNPTQRSMPTPGRWLRKVPRSLLLAATLGLLLAGVALGIRFGLDLLRIEFRPIPTLAPAATFSSQLGLGTRTSLEAVTAEAAFPVVVPADPGSPDAVFLGGQLLRGQVAFLYAPREGLPASEYLGGAGLLITQNRGSADTGLVNKVINSGGIVELATVGDDRAYWFAGEPHWFWYLGPDGEVVPETGRRVGNTLAWQRGDILFRIEGDISLERALEIAATMP